MSSDFGIIAITATLVAVIAVVLIVHRWYANTTLYRNPRR